MVPEVDSRTETVAPTDRFPAVLAVATLGVYLLVVVGATTALTDGATACSTWPTCDGRLVVLDGGAMTVAWAHRVLALIVGLVVAGTAVLGLSAGAPSRRIGAAVVLAAVLFVLQVGIGAITATAGTRPVLSGLHLLVGMTIFGTYVVALAWTLDERYGAAERSDVPPAAPADLDDPPSDPRPTAGSTDQIPLRSRLSAYLQLTKPRLMWLLCLVAVAAMALAAGPALAPGTVAATILGGVLAIGASGTFNHVLERDLDRHMDRTADRPVAMHVVPVPNAVAFGLALAAGSIAVFYWLVNPLAALLGATAIVFYSVVYTLVLKPNTVQNTVIGGFAGALPALIGWAAVTETVGLPALVLSSVIFLWTPAHFYNLALAYKDDYARAGFPMLPVVRGERVTRRHIVLYLGATLIAAAALAGVDTLGWVYAATAVALGTLFLSAVVALHRDRTDRAAFRSFHASNAYLGGLLVAVLVDALVV